MTHPTDDELEAMAARLEDGRVCSPAQNSCRNGYLMLEAAAMLRACKGRVKRLPRTDGEGGWTLPVELLAEIRDEVYANEWDAPCAEVIEIIAISTETRILAALEPAPDHAEWDAAIEAAANASDDYAALCRENREAGADWISLSQESHDPRVGLSAADREELDRLVANAAVLIDDDDQNPEYTRGMAELIMLRMGWSSDELDAIIGWVRDVEATL